MNWAYNLVDFDTKHAMVLLKIEKFKILAVRAQRGTKAKKVKFFKKIFENFYIFALVPPLGSDGQNLEFFGFQRNHGMFGIKMLQIVCPVDSTRLETIESSVTPTSIHQA